jgi:hypothetical protein
MLKIIPLLLILGSLIGCSSYGYDPKTMARLSQVTIFSSYLKHHTKGRGTIVQEDGERAFILTAKHVVNLYPDLVKIKVVGLSGREYVGRIDTLYKCSDMALISIPTHFTGYLNIQDPRFGEGVFAFDYAPNTPFDNAFIGNEINIGRVTEEANKRGGLWEDPMLGALANYTSHEGMSGEGVFDPVGNLVGIHSSKNGAGEAVFVPIHAALEKEWSSEGKPCF